MRAVIGGLITAHPWPAAGDEGPTLTVGDPVRIANAAQPGEAFEATPLYAPGEDLGLSDDTSVVPNTRPGVNGSLLVLVGYVVTGLIIDVIGRRVVAPFTVFDRDFQREIRTRIPGAKDLKKKKTLMLYFDQEKEAQFRFSTVYAGHPESRLVRLTSATHLKDILQWGFNTQPDFEVLEVMTHGRPGAIKVGNGWGGYLDLNDLRTLDQKNFQPRLRPKILVLNACSVGCSTQSGPVGEEFLQGLHSMLLPKDGTLVAANRITSAAGGRIGSILWRTAHFIPGVTGITKILIAKQDRGIFQRQRAISGAEPVTILGPGEGAPVTPCLVTSGVANAD